jgi:hypothetical protein
MTNVSAETNTARRGWRAFGYRDDERAVLHAKRIGSSH